MYNGQRVDNVVERSRVRDDKRARPEISDVQREREREMKQTVGYEQKKSKSKMKKDEGTKT